MNLILSKLDKDIELKRLIDFDHTLLSYGWNLENKPNCIVFIGASKNNLYFSFRLETSVKYDQKNNKYDFIEGLWKDDVAEIFIQDANLKSYQEFNFAPSGAYWTSFFSDYRKQDKEKFKPILNLEIDSTVFDTSWELAVKIPIDSLSIEFNFLNFINICSIVHKQKIHYLSMQNLISENPDFHLLKIN